MKASESPARRGSLGPCAATSVLALLASCKGDDGATGPPGPSGVGPTSTVVARGEAPPGIDIQILQLSGASGPTGNFQVGDRMSVTFTIKKDDGSDWDITEMGRGRILVSGPSFNYNRVLPEATDVPTASVKNADGSYTYTFAAPLPAVYAAPYNDTSAYDETDGELTGQPLVDGTYTVGLYTRWDFTVGEDSARDAGNATMDFLLGGATTLAHREVVLQENCNRCHTDFRIHGGMRKEVSLCVLCHTSGSEDRNTGGVTPGVSVDFRVMIHKIHNGAHLPSVLGVATKDTGARDYTATPKPYEVVGFGTSDFSDVAFPAFPNLAIGMPRDEGYSGLMPQERALENQILTGVTGCVVCHGDPDGSGPASAPAQGGLAYSQPSRRACGSCHDDVNWDFPYTSNTQTMPRQEDDSACMLCHDPGGNSLAVMDAHLHPLLDEDVNPGLVLEVLDVIDVPKGPTGVLDGRLQPGEGMQLSLTLRDDAGNEVDPASLGSTSLVVSGPTRNSNLLLSTSVPAEVLTGAQPFLFDVPMPVTFELAGTSMNGVSDEEFVTALSPHLDGPSSGTTVFSAAPSGTGTFLTAKASALTNFIDVDDATGIDPDEYVVLDFGLPGAAEYLRVQWVDDNDRIWFASPAQGGYQPALRYDHPIGASVDVATLTELDRDVAYSLEPTTGTITEIGDLGDVGVVVSYTTDFLFPDTYGPPLNDGPEIGEESGQWTGKSLVDGTYTVTLWSTRNVSVDTFGEVTTYRGTSPPAKADFLVGTATTLEPYDVISSAENCYACHQDLWFHGGGRRGFDTCIACHGTAGAEDRPQYRAWGAPATTGVLISYREMLHKIHMGEELANAAAYTVVGFGAGGPPNNFTPHHYDEVLFPALPGGVRNCTACHGTATTWMSPRSRNHPTEQGTDVASWRQTCNACHDSDAATAHIRSQTFGGVEACSICHGPGEEWNVRKMHKAY